MKFNKGREIININIKMTRDQKIQQALKLVEAMVGGYFSQENRKLTGLVKDVWVRLFENCYEGINAMLEKVEKMDSVKSVN